MVGKQLSSVRIHKQILGLLLDDLFQKASHNLHAANLTTPFHTPTDPLRDLQWLECGISFFAHAELLALFLRNNAQHVIYWVSILMAIRRIGFDVEKFVGIVRRQPMLESLKLFVIGFGVRKRHLVRTKRAFDEFAVELFRSRPALLKK